MVNKRVSALVFVSVLCFGQQYDASKLRGKLITNPLQPLDQQGLGWTTASQKFIPYSYSLQSGGSNYCAPSGASTTTYTCNLTPALTAYSAGLVIAVKPDVTNTASSTLNANSLGAKTIQKLSSGALTNLSSGDFVAGVVYLLRYNGTVFIIDPGIASGGTSSGNAPTVTKTSTARLDISSGVWTTGNAIQWSVSASNVVITVGPSSSGTCYLYGDSAGSVIVQCPTAGGITATCTGCNFQNVTTPAIAVGAIQLASITFTTGGWGTLTDLRSSMIGFGVTAGDGIVCTGTGLQSCAVDRATVPDPTSTTTVTGPWNFNSASSTAPNQSGTSLPGTCAVGQSYQKTDATAASQLYLCTSLNTWTAQGGSGAGYSLHFGSASATSPADATTYYIGNFTAGLGFATTDDATQQAFKIVAPKAGTITSMAWTAQWGTGAGVAGSGESVSIGVCISTVLSGVGSCTNVKTTDTWNNTYSTQSQVGSLSIAVAAGDRLLVRIVTPTWVTNPTNVIMSGTIQIQ